MKRAPLFLLGLATILTILFCAPVHAEQHRATRLGNPATRFAPTIFNVEDLRARFRDEKLRPDFDTVLKQWGWPGNINDMFAAAATNEVVEWPIAIGTTMPFMSSRENGKAICLRNVLWVGKEPAPAYAFLFNSNGRRYRCITPKACSNFFVEDLGPEPRSAIAIDCSAPAEVPAGRPITVCLTVRNTGNIPEPKITVTLPTPPGATIIRTTEGGVIATNGATWEISDLTPDATKQVCATLAMRQLGPLPFAPAAIGTIAKSVQSACATKIVGIAAILQEVVDLEDPVEVGSNVTYEIKITNQGSAVGTNIRPVCTLPASQEFVSSTGATPAKVTDRTITMDALPTLAPEAEAVWRVVVKATRADDARFKVETSSDQFEVPIPEDESTQQY